MKRKVLIYAGILAVLLLAATAWRLRPAPGPEGSPLYQRFRDLPGVRVGFVKDFPLGDSLRVDVTTFEALTDEGWQTLRDSMHFKLISEGMNIDSCRREWGDAMVDDLLRQEMEPNHINYWQKPPNHPEQENYRRPSDVEEVDVYMASVYFRFVTVYHVTTDQIHSLIVKTYLRSSAEGHIPLLPNAIYPDTIKQQKTR